MLCYAVYYIGKIISSTMGNQLNFVKQYKYLGLIFCSNFSWSSHINFIVNRARRLVGLLYRKFYEHLNSQTLFKLYCSFIRPHLEYASVVWSPHLVKDRAAIEKIQHFALRICLKDWSLGYDVALDRAHLPSLTTRRDRAGLCYMCIAIWILKVLQWNQELSHVLKAQQ